MKIEITSDKSPLDLTQFPSAVETGHPREVSVTSPPDSRMYVKLTEDCDVPHRHPGELVLRNGWACLDYDKEGFLVGIEIVEGDPFTGTSECISYLQPTNPLLQ